MKMLTGQNPSQQLQNTGLMQQIDPMQALFHQNQLGVELNLGLGAGAPAS